MELSLNDLRDLLCGQNVLSTKDAGSEDYGVISTLYHGYCIAVLDKGFIYVGNVKTDADWIYISNANNVRNWTGNHGLSWYADNGFEKDITLDHSGDVKAPFSEIKHLIVCTERP